jgi:hypothetical protein
MACGACRAVAGLVEVGAVPLRRLQRVPPRHPGQEGLGWGSTSVEFLVECRKAALSASDC